MNFLLNILVGGHLFLLGSLSKNNELRQKEGAVQILKDSFRHLKSGYQW